LEAEFWHERWRNNQIGFHESKPNALLVRHVERLDLSRGDRVFVPLCGKTLYIAWLLAQGFAVCGIELSETAVEQLFAELGAAPEITAHGRLRRYSADALDVFVGDIFDLSLSALGPVDAIYDRAALIALPEAMRRRYASHLTDVTDSAPQLLICLEYDQDLMTGPPFSIRESTVRELYDARYRISKLESVSLPDGLKGSLPATETSWLLERR